MVEMDENGNLNDEMEQEFRDALRPVPAPAGFIDRVVARTRELPLLEPLPFPVRHRGLHPALRWSIAAVLLLAVSFGGIFEHQRRRRIAGERARQQVMLALHITSVTLRAVRDRVDKSGRN